MNLDDYSYEENARRYVNPQVGLNERNAFIDNLRQSWGQDTAKISSDTRALGSKVPSVRGGLTGGSSYFKSRYQTPQANSMIADLRAVAQSQALSTAMNNEIAKAKKRYQDAYKAAQAKTKKTVGDNELTVTKKYGNESNPYHLKQTDDVNVSEEFRKKYQAERPWWQALYDSITGFDGTNYNEVWNSKPSGVMEGMLHGNSNQLFVPRSVYEKNGD